MAASRLLLQSVFHCRLQPSTAFTSFSTLPCRAIHSRTASIGYQHSLSSPVYHARGPKISLSTLYPSPTRVPLQKNHTFLSSQRSYHSSDKGASSDLPQVKALNSFASQLRIEGDAISALIKTFMVYWSRLIVRPCYVVLIVSCSGD